MCVYGTERTNHKGPIGTMHKLCCYEAKYKDKR